MVQYVQGVSVREEIDIQGAVEAAKEAEVVVVCVGRTLSTRGGGGLGVPLPFPPHLRRPLPLQLRLPPWL